ncbi:Phage antirepressor protein YoqD, KilAC domain [Capnocytophaga haemolytica]|uniref:Uncharacterized phage-encoded protein n=1 Tax=Capnocytophaga haemolytica TaxID=45243 RepID=A0AAX2GVR8_9FLAO|nr:phage regulatory protein/antirepressor Ant [Capnocytophaga haemolytica]AMD85111.1 hypothetical protein AXF12_06010 [Capnocytophaga haemolytica]SFN67864.1 Phage antirepressor protein YoqD, KilAC domain [Capnocytophaga haemolytica]SNV04935.1 Uncharacterized phage-encoded protein [Capnocytophaga haemolytica]
MKELVKFEASAPQTMSSREIAELTNKRHDHVIRDVENLNNSYEKLALPKIGEGYYTHPNTGNQQHREFRLTKMQTLDLLTGYSAELRIKVNRRWAELEEKAQTPPPAIPQTFAEALRLAAMQAERLELQAAELKKQAPKVAYFDNVLQSESTYPTTLIAKELGMSAIKLNQRLHQLGVQYNQSGVWVLYSQHQDKGYTKTITRTFVSNEGKEHTSMLTVWTEKGRLFIHNLLKSS